MTPKELATRLRGLATQLDKLPPHSAPESIETDEIGALLISLATTAAPCADEIGLTPCPIIQCPCGCQGVLQVEGRNTLDTLMFLQCSTCACAYVAYDVPKHR